ncbi:alpha/beta hydrolase [Pedobacter sp. AW31-3R]|uniref:alpha/beta hydrolase n=1 Tax=Pedobacter sp. AW31-3R TaxID=3445781 RepID=UPI003FA061E6
MKKYSIGIVLVLIVIISFSFKMNHTTPQPALHYVVRQPKLHTDKVPLVILLHGVGSNEQNMFSFADALPDKFKVVSARGPLMLGKDSYGWFQVQFGSQGPVINEMQAEKSRKVILQFIEDLKTVEEFDEHQVYLMGFSQGGIMSYSVALTSPEKIAGIAVMSGRLLPEVKPLVVSSERLKKLRIFISHGKQDPVLRFGFATDALSYLEGKGLQPDFHAFDEVHKINGEMLAEVIRWLNN